MPTEVEKAQQRVEKLRRQLAEEQAKAAVVATEGEDAVVLAQLANEEKRLQAALDAVKAQNPKAAQQRAVARIEAQGAVYDTPAENAKPMNPPPDGAPSSVDPDAASYEEALKAANTGPETGVVAEPAPTTTTTTSKGKD